MRLTVGQALRLTLVGGAIGLALSVALSRVMESALLGIATSDARVLAGFAAVLIASALLAGYLPARRAAAIDPDDRAAGGVKGQGSGIRDQGSGLLARFARSDRESAEAACRWRRHCGRLAG